jgi:hypothetical protein
MFAVGSFVRYIGEPVRTMSFPQSLEVIGRNPRNTALVDVRDLKGTEFYIHNAFLRESFVERPAPTRQA